MPLEQCWPQYMMAVANPKQPAASFLALEKIFKTEVGTLLFTASTFDIPAGKSRRVHSDNEAAYPTGGFKPIAPGKWTQTVLVEKRPFASLRIEEIAEVFFDWKLIQSLGCESNLNIPVVVGGNVIGTVNLLHQAGYYTPDRVQRAMTLVPFAVIAFLIAALSGATPVPGA